MEGGALLDLGHCLVDGLCDIVDVLGGETTHVDTTAGHQVDMLLLNHVLHLLSCRKEGKERERERERVERDQATLSEKYWDYKG